MARGGWSMPLGGFIQEVEGQLSKQGAEMVLYALQQLIIHSPVDEGAYRGSHFLTIDDVDHDKVPHYGPDESMREAERILAANPSPFKLVTIQTNIPYGERIEDGWSGQAPYGVYSIAYNNTRERYGR